MFFLTGETASNVTTITRGFWTYFIINQVTNFHVIFNEVVGKTEDLLFQM